MKMIRIIAKTIATVAVYAVLIGVMSVVLFYIFYRAFLLSIPAGPGDYLLYAAGLFAALAVPLHYKLRRRLRGTLSYLSILEAFVFTAPAIAMAFMFEEIPAPFYPNDSPGLMIYQGVVMVLMLAVPAGYALMNLYLVVERNVKRPAHRRHRSSHGNVRKSSRR